MFSLALNQTHKQFAYCPNCDIIQTGVAKGVYRSSKNQNACLNHSEVIPEYTAINVPPHPTGFYQAFLALFRLLFHALTPLSLASSSALLLLSLTWCFSASSLISSITSGPIPVPCIQSRRPYGAKFPCPCPSLCRSCLRAMPPRMIPGTAVYPDIANVSSIVTIERSSKYVRRWIRKITDGR